MSHSYLFWWDGSFLFVGYFCHFNCSCCFGASGRKDKLGDSYKACRAVIDTARIDEPARNPCRLWVSWMSQDIDSSLYLVVLGGQGLTLSFQPRGPKRSFDINKWSKTRFLVIIHTILGP